MMTIIDPPKIDRAKLCREAEARRAAQGALQQALALLQPGERLGPPAREGDHLVVPILPAEAATPPSLTATWLDAPDG